MRSKRIVLITCLIALIVSILNFVFLPLSGVVENSDNFHNSYPLWMIVFGGVDPLTQIQFAASIYLIPFYFLPLVASLIALGCYTSKNFLFFSALLALASGIALCFTIPILGATNYLLTNDFNLGVGVIITIIVDFIIALTLGYAWLKMYRYDKKYAL